MRMVLELLFGAVLRNAYRNSDVAAVAAVGRHQLARADRKQAAARGARQGAFVEVVSKQQAAKNAGSILLHSTADPVLNLYSCEIHKLFSHTQPLF